jgi:hypothetical protein
MPRKTNNKNNSEPTNEDKPARSTTKRTTTRRTTGQEQEAGGRTNPVNDHERAFEHQQRDRGEVF